MPGGLHINPEGSSVMLRLVVADMAGAILDKSGWTLNRVGIGRGTLKKKQINGRSFFSHFVRPTSGNLKNI